MWMLNHLLWFIRHLRSHKFSYKQYFCKPIIVYEIISIFNVALWWHFKIYYSVGWGLVISILCNNNSYDYLYKILSICVCILLRKRKESLQTETLLANFRNIRKLYTWRSHGTSEPNRTWMLMSKTIFYTIG